MDLPSGELNVDEVDEGFAKSVRDELDCWRWAAEGNIDNGDFKNAALCISGHNELIRAATGVDAHWETFE